MTKSSEKRVMWKVPAKVTKRARTVRLKSPYEFDHQRKREVVQLPEVERELTDSDRRDLAAAEAKRQRKATAGLAA